MDEAAGVGVGPAERAHHAGGDGPTPQPRRRMSARRKQEAVLRLLPGEDLELVSHDLAVTALHASTEHGDANSQRELSVRVDPLDILCFAATLAWIKP
jgi:hypothetical protein